jgi:hypothetical protein
MEPFIGQFISGARAMWKCDRKMLNALDWLQIAAVDLHLRVFAVNALTIITNSLISNYPHMPVPKKSERECDREAAVVEKPKNLKNKDP